MRLDGGCCGARQLTSEDGGYVRISKNSQQLVDFPNSRKHDILSHKYEYICALEQLGRQLACATVVKRRLGNDVHVKTSCTSQIYSFIS